MVLELRRDGGDEPLANAFDVSVHVAVAQQRKLLFGFRGRLAAQSDVVHRTVFIIVKFDLGLRRRGSRHQPDYEQKDNERERLCAPIIE
jgi:hypothetical protein